QGPDVTHCTFSSSQQAAQTRTCMNYLKCPSAAPRQNGSGAGLRRAGIHRPTILVKAMNKALLRGEAQFRTRRIAGGSVLTDDQRIRFAHIKIDVAVRSQVFRVDNLA